MKNLLTVTMILLLLPILGCSGGSSSSASKDVPVESEPVDPVDPVPPEVPDYPAVVSATITPHPEEAGTYTITVTVSNPIAAYSDRILQSSSDESIAPSGRIYSIPTGRTQIQIGSEDNAAIFHSYEYWDFWLEDYPSSSVRVHNPSFVSGDA